MKLSLPSPSWFAKTPYYFKLLKFSLISAQYAVYLNRYIKEWRKNPRWSFSCCLALLLPLNDLQEELRWFTDANAFPNQTGEIGTLGILSAVKSSVAIDAFLEKGDHYYDKIVKVKDENDQDTYIRRHQGTQTELCSILVTEIVIQSRWRESKM